MSGNERTVVFQLPSVLSGQLACVAGSVAGRSWELSAGTFTVGRADTCDLSLTSEPGVSKAHAKIVAEGERYVLYDLESRNGTLVNGQPVQRHNLHDGDEVRICNCILRFTSRAKTGTAVKQFDPPMQVEQSEPSITAPSGPPDIAGAPTVRAMPRSQEVDRQDVVEHRIPTEVSIVRARKKSGPGLVAWYAAGLLASLVLGGGASAALVATAPAPANDVKLAAIDPVQAEIAARARTDALAPAKAEAAAPAPAAPATPPTLASDPPPDEPKAADDTKPPPTREERAAELAAAVEKQAEADRLAKAEAPEEPAPPVEDAPRRKSTKVAAAAKATRSEEASSSSSASSPSAAPSATPSSASPAAPEPEARAASDTWYGASIDEGKSETVRAKSGGKVRTVDVQDGAVVAKGDAIVSFGEGASKAEIATLKESIRSLEGIAADNESAARQLEEQKAKLAALQSADRNGSVTAPAAGKLVGLSVRAGDTVKPGQVIGRIVEGGTLARVKIVVSKGDAARVKRGDRVELRGKNGSTGAGTVLSVARTVVMIDPGVYEAADVAEARLK